MTFDGRQSQVLPADLPADFDRSERFVLAALADDVCAAKEILAGPLDYARLTQFALRNEVVGEVAQFVSKHGLVLDLSVIQALASFVERLADHNKRVERETARLARLLDAEAVPAIFAKGAVAAKLYRDDGALRTTKDVDVYVERSGIKTVLEALRPHYEIPDRDEGPSLRHDLRWLHHVSLWSSQNEVMVELHFGMAAPRHGLRFDLAEAIERRVPIDVAGQTVMTLSPGDALAFWSLELAKDSWASLKKILDFARSVDAAVVTDKSLAEAFSAARLRGAERMLRIALIVSARLGMLDRSFATFAQAAGDPRALSIAQVGLDKLARGGSRPALWRRAQEGICFAQKHDRVAAQLSHVMNIIILFRLRNSLRSRSKSS